MSDELHWLPMSQRIECKLSALIFKSLHQIALPYLTKLYVLVSSDVHENQPLLIWIL